MNITRPVAASVIGAGLAAACVFASPASADDLDGAYTLDIGGSDQGTWALTQCEESFVPCVHVAQTGGEAQPWNADAHLSVGYWTMFVDRPDAIGCKDGSVHPGQVSYSWDAVTLSGWTSSYNTGVCGDKPQTLSAPFTLVKVN